MLDAFDLSKAEVSSRGISYRRRTGAGLKDEWPAIDFGIEGFIAPVGARATDSREKTGTPLMKALRGSTNNTPSQPRLHGVGYASCDDRIARKDARILRISLHHG